MDDKFKIVSTLVPSSEVVNNTNVVNSANDKEIAFAKEALTRVKTNFNNTDVKALRQTLKDRKSDPRVKAQLDALSDDEVREIALNNIALYESLIPLPTDETTVVYLEDDNIVFTISNSEGKARINFKDKKEYWDLVDIIL